MASKKPVKKGSKKIAIAKKKTTAARKPVKTNKVKATKKTTAKATKQTKAASAKTKKPMSVKKSKTAKKTATTTNKKSSKPSIAKNKSTVKKTVKPSKKTVKASHKNSNTKTKSVSTKKVSKPATSAKKVLKATKKSSAITPKLTNKNTTTMNNNRNNTNSSAMSVSPYERKTDESYMNDEQLHHFSHILRLWKTQLMREVDSTIHHMQDDAANFPDPNDRATQEEEFSLELRARDRERKLIRKIDEALQKIEAQEYGYCDECGVEIGIRRLEARPTATLCIDCKTLDEIKEKQLASDNH